jgi:hypothetical protein
MQNRTSGMIAVQSREHLVDGAPAMNRQDTTALFGSHFQDSFEYVALVVRMLTVAIAAIQTDLAHISRAAEQLFEQR